MVRMDEKKFKEFFGNLMLDAMKNQDQIVVDLIGQIERCEKETSGLMNFVQAVDDGKTSEKQVTNMIKNLSITMASHAAVLKRVLGLLLVYVASDSFSTNAAMFANKLGYGQEALQQMFDKKLKGR